MTEWAGINRGSLDIANNLFTPRHVENVRFTKDGELQRRRGQARTNLAKEATCIKAISGFSPYQSNTFASVITCGGVWEGTTGPRGLWNDVYDPPDGPDGPRNPPSSINGYAVLSADRIQRVDSSFQVVSTFVNSSDFRGGLLRVSNGWLASYNDGIYFHGDDGSNTKRHNWATTPRQIVYVNNRYFAAGRTIGAESNDGITWTPVSYDGGTILNGLCQNASYAFGVGQTTANDPWIERSTSDFAWGWTIAYPPDYASGGSQYSIASKGNIIVSVGTRNPGNSTVRVNYSTDNGATWMVASGRPPDSAARFGVFVASNGSMFLMLTSDGMLWRSYDGNMWEQIPRPSNYITLSFIIAGCEDGYFYCKLFPEENDLYRSNDGYSWSKTGMTVSGDLVAVSPKR